MPELHLTPLILFIFQAMAIVALGRAIGLLTRRLGQPMVIAEVVAGICLGPSLLGWLFPDLLPALFPASSMPVLGLVSQVGLVLFMFLVGLEMDPRLLRGRGRTSVAISHSSIVAPFALGAVLALYLYPRVSSPDVPYTSFALFMGVAMSITAFPVLARILAERQLLRTKVGAITIACAAVDDVTAWCALAFVVSIVRASGLDEAAWTTVLALGYVAFMVFGARPFLARLAARSPNREGLTQNVVAVTFLMLFASAAATELIGIHALFGAFLLGAVMPRDGGFTQAMAEKMEDVVVVLLLPLFFAYSGLRTQVGLLDSADAWAMCALIIAVACAGKFGGSAIAARLTGLNWREAGAIGILMNTRGLMELIVLNIGLDLGVISPTLFTMMVLMALATTFMTSPLLQWVYPMEEMARDHAEVPPAPEPAEAAPAYTVLMCVSDPMIGPGMATLAGALIGPEPRRGRLFALRLLPTPERPSDYIGEDLEPPGAEAFHRLSERADRLGLEVRTLAFGSQDPGPEICRVADVKGADLVLLGSHKPLLGRTVLGGTVREVLDQADADVGVLVDRGLSEVRRVLVPYHGAPHDGAALALAGRLAERSGVGATVLHVVRPGSGPRAPAEPAGDGWPPEVVGLVEQGGDVRLERVEHDSPADAAVAEAERGPYDLVIVGVGREWGLEQRAFGVHPERIVADCPTSLLLVRQRPAAARA